MVLLPLPLPLFGLIAAPLMLGLINKTKAFFAGRRGPPLLQPYYDLARLLRKGAVYSRTTTGVFPAGPVIGLAATAAVLLVLPMGGVPAPVPFPGDFLVLAGFLALARFVTVLAALDTGSSFEGMGASREVQFAALAEPALLLGLAALAKATGTLSLTGMTAAISMPLWSESAPALTMVTAALAVVALAENARIPVDDPSTHLELTMIHEVMVLDHSGPDLAFLEYAAALKFWILGALVVGVGLPWRTGVGLIDLVLAVGGLLAWSVAVGIVESSMARLRLLRVPQLLVGASALAAVALALTLR